MCDKTDSKYISEIHNYCDRWCERCTFTASCRVFELEQSYKDEEKNINNNAFWKKMAADFSGTKEKLVEMSELHNMDLFAVSNDELAVLRVRESDFVENCKLAILSEKYSKDAKALLKIKGEWLFFSTISEDEQNEMLEIIYWYQHFISKKIERALSGLLDIDGNFDDEELNDLQSDTNGSIKIAQIAIERSIMAWANLVSNENSQPLQPIISLLKAIQNNTENAFPKARDFIRPGFDEIEIVM